MRTPPLPADFIHIRVCKPKCEKLLTLPQNLQNVLFIAVVTSWEPLTVAELRTVISLNNEKSPLQEVVLLLPTEGCFHLYNFTL